MMEPVSGVGVWQQAGDQGGGVLDPGRHHQGQGGVFTRQGGATRTMEERDVLGGIWVAPEGLNFFPFEDLHVCPFVPNFTFTFASESEIWSCTILFCTVSNSMWPGPERRNMLCELKYIERKIQERVFVYQEVWENNKEHHDCQLYLTFINIIIESNC